MVKGKEILAKSKTNSGIYEVKDAVERKKKAWQDYEAYKPIKIKVWE